MLSHEIRSRFLEYFEGLGHLRIPSASLVPRDDPSMLLVDAGMVPFKPFFLGLRPPPALRLTSCQKALRTTDIEDVGDASHDTFFEMLGNFTFGDYFKAEAIEFAYLLATQGFQLPPDRLFFSVHPSDSVSRELWRQVARVGDDRIVALEDNFWQAGPVGPCGVDSELYYDLGEQFAAGPDDRPGAGPRYLEFWNLVFMDSERLEDGRTVPLERPGVDTGLGLERMAMILQGRSSIYDTDLFAPLLEEFLGRSQADLGRQERERHLRILADHTRAACMLICDGVVPGNQGRGYVLRRLLRRALVSARGLDLQGGLAPAVATVEQILAPQYPELAPAREHIVAAITQEEERFEETRARGIEHFEQAAGRAAAGVISGADTFRLHDTYGFPVELTVDLAASRGLAVDRAGFGRLLEEQRERARLSREALPSAAGPDWPASRFVGYDQLEVDAQVLMIARAGGVCDEALPGESVEVVLDQTPFYAEGGGQMGDRGLLSWEGGKASVVDTQAAGQETRVQRCRIEQGRLAAGARLTARVDVHRRQGSAAHHSATHLLNAALRRTLGPGVVQRGSLVGPDHATFDFSWPAAMTEEQITAAERLVNGAVRQDLERRIDHLSMAQARAAGALALPDEAYSESVRVVSFGDFSKELCGGTHVERAGQIGAVILVGERSIGAGVRRLELLAGPAAELWWEEQRQVVQQVSRALRSGPAEAVSRLESLQQRVRQLERQLREGRRQEGAAGWQREQLDGVVLAIEDVADLLDRRELLQHADRLVTDADVGAALVLAGGRLALKLSADLVSRGLHAGRLAAAACGEAGGKGGGNDQLGMGGVPRDGHPAVLQAVRKLLLDARG